MIVSRRINDPASLAAFLRGAEVATGSAGVTSGDTSFSDATTDAFDAAVVGQTIYISGEGAFTIATKTDANNLVLSGACSGTNTAVHWRVASNPIDMANVHLIAQDPHSHSFVVVHDITTFSV
jgi:hypothetical protein